MNLVKDHCTVKMNSKNGRNIFLTSANVFDAENTVMTCEIATKQSNTCIIFIKASSVTCDFILKIIFQFDSEKSLLLGKSKLKGNINPYVVLAD